MTRAGQLPSPRTGCSQGLSLVELRVANLLGLMLMAGVTGLYLASKRQFLHDEQLARLQENGRYAIELLRRELAMAGLYGGLLNTDELAPESFTGDCSAPPWALDAASPLAFTDDHDAAAGIRTTTGISLGCIDGTDVARSTDILAVRRTAAQATVDEGMLAPGFSSYSGLRWYLHHAPGLSPAWRRLTAEEVLWTAADSQEVNLWKAVAKIFYVRNFSDSANRSDDLPALCVEELVKETMITRCLVEGVEDLQLELGVDTDRDAVANRYISPGQVMDYEGAVSARVHLLLRSIYRVVGPPDDSIFTLGRRQVSKPRDGYLRRVFSTTVMLRNLGPRPILVVNGELDAAA